jgi:hypothetical protein
MKMKINKAEFYKTVENKYLPNEHQSVLILREVDAEELPLNVIKVKGRVSNYIGTMEEALLKLKNTYDLKLNVDNVTIQNVKVDKVETDGLGFGMVCIELSVVPSRYTGDMVYKGGGIKLNNSDIRGFSPITDNSSLVKLKENEKVVNLRELSNDPEFAKKLFNELDNGVTVNIGKDGVKSSDLAASITEAINKVTKNNLN